MIMRIIVIAAGVVAGIILAYLVAFGIGWGWGPLYAGEEDMARNVKVFLAGSVVVAIACGWIADWLYTRNLRHRSR